MSTETLTQQLENAGYVVHIRRGIYSEDVFMVTLESSKAGIFGISVTELELKTARVTPFEHIVFKMNRVIQENAYSPFVPR